MIKYAQIYAIKIVGIRKNYILTAYIQKYMK